MTKVSKRARLAYVTVAALSSTFMSSEAWADCISQSPVDNASVICGGPGASGWGPNSGSFAQTAVNSLKVTVNAGATVTNSEGGNALINAGTGSSVINFSGSFNNNSGSSYGINASGSGGAAISVGAGSIVTNNSDADMLGSITFGSATGSTVNTLNNNYSPTSGPGNLIGVIDGNVISNGNTVINNQGLIGWGAVGGIIQHGAGAVTITNGVVGGYATTFAGTYTFQNGIVGTDGITTDGSTTLTNNGGPGMGGAIFGTISLGNVGNGSGTGTSTIINGSPGQNATILGNVTMNDHNNVVTNDGTIVGNVTMNGTGTNVYNAGSAGSSGDNGLRLPGSQIDVNGLPTGTVTGTLQGLAANSANNTLNLNGVTNSSFLQSGSVIKDFGTVNKNDTGTWTIKNTLDGDAGKLTTINVNGGALNTQNAAFLGTSSTTVKLANSTALVFTGSFAGTFNGNIVDATGATTGQVQVLGASVTTLGGTNTYHGTTTIDGGTLATGSTGALSPNSDFTIQNGGTLNINNSNTIKSLSDAGSGTNTVNLNGSNTLTLGSGTWGGHGGTITGTGYLTKVSTGTFTLAGANAVNLTGSSGGASGLFSINDGTVNVNTAGAIGANTLVGVYSTATTTGVLNVNQGHTIGALGGIGANAQVNIASGKTLTSGGVSGSEFDGHIAGGGALAKTGNVTLTLKGTNSYTGGTTVLGGTLAGFAGIGAGTSSLQGNITVTSPANVTFDQTLNPAGAGSGTYAGNLSGSGTATFMGNGSTVLTLSGDNHLLLGQMNFVSGTVAIGVANNLGTGNMDFTGGTLENTANVTLANTVSLTGAGTFLTDPSTTLTLNGIISGAGGLTKTGGGTLVLGGANTYSGGTTVSAGTLQGQAGTGLQGNIVDNAAVIFTGTGTYAGNLSGTGTVEIAPTATTFSGTNTYTGNTTVDATATLTAGLNNLSGGSSHIVNGTLTLTGNNAIASLGGANTGVVNLGASTLTLNNTANATYSGLLNGAGTGSLVVANGGGNWTFNGTTGTSLVAFTNNGTTTLDGTLSATTGTNNGTLFGTGIFNGAFTNNGTIKPGHSPGIMTFNGSYTQSNTGNYVIDINAHNSSSVTAGVDYDQIHVGGTPATATLAGTATINQNGGEFVNGTVYHILTTQASTTGATDGFITGSFNFVGTHISSFISLVPSVAGSTNNNATTHSGDYTLTVVRTNYNTVANNPNQAAVAGLTSSSGLQGLVGVPNAAGIVSAVDNMSDADARSFFDQISPEAYGAYVVALQDQGNLFSRQVAHRMESAKSNGDAKMAVWGNLYGQWGNGSHQSFRHGSDQDTKGGALGVDGNLAGDFTLGAAGGYSEDDVKYRLGNSKGTSKSWQVGGYASFHPGKLAADVQVDYIHGKVNAGQVVGVGSGFSALSGVASANTSGNLLKVVGTVGYSLGSETLAFTPFVGVDFTTGHLGGFNLHGTGGPLLETVLRQRANRTDLLAGFKFAPNMGKLTPYADATIRYGMSRNHGFVSAYFDDLPSDVFTVSAERSNKMQGELDAGLSYAIGKSGSIFFGYQGTMRSDLTENGVNGGVKFAF